MIEKRILSFVRREGRISTRQQRAIEKVWDHYVIHEFSPSLASFDGKLILEIGFGMGKSLFEMAKANPDQRFIGIEVYRSGVGSLLADLEEHNLQNVHIFCDDAVDVLENSIPDASLDRVQLFFPDPWPKKRHHKRRLVQPLFVEKIANKLKSGGVFHIATDWQDYAEHILAVLSSSSRFFNSAGAGQFTQRPAYRPLTKYERRGQALGHEVWDLIFKTFD